MPAIDRDTFHETTLLEAPSNLALSTSGMGPPQHLWAACCSVSLLTKVFLKPSVNLPSFSSKTLPLFLSLQALISVFLIIPFHVRKNCSEVSLQSLLFSRLNIFFLCIVRYIITRTFPRDFESNVVLILLLIRFLNSTWIYFLIAC